MADLFEIDADYRPNVAINEDLSQAIRQLQAVPALNWSQSITFDDDWTPYPVNDGVVSSPVVADCSISQKQRGKTEGYEQVITDFNISDLELQSRNEYEINSDLFTSELEAIANCTLHGNHQDLTCPGITTFVNELSLPTVVNCSHGLKSSPHSKCTSKIITSVVQSKSSLITSTSTLQTVNVNVTGVNQRNTKEQQSSDRLRLLRSLENPTGCDVKPLSYTVHKVRKHALARNLVECSPDWTCGATFPIKNSARRANHESSERGEYNTDGMRYGVRSESGPVEPDWSRRARSESPENAFERILEEIGNDEKLAKTASQFNSSGHKTTVASNTNDASLTPGSRDNYLSSRDELVSREFIKTSQDTVQLTSVKLLSLNTPIPDEDISLSIPVKQVEMPNNGRLEFSSITQGQRTFDSIKTNINIDDETSKRESLNGRFGDADRSTASYSTQREKSPEEIFEEILESLATAAKDNDTDRTFTTDLPISYRSAETQDFITIGDDLDVFPTIGSVQNLLYSEWGQANDRRTTNSGVRKQRLYDSSLDAALENLTSIGMTSVDDFTDRKSDSYGNYVARKTKTRADSNFVGDTDLYLYEKLSTNDRFVDSKQQTVATTNTSAFDYVVPVTISQDNGCLQTVSSSHDRRLVYTEKSDSAIATSTVSNYNQENLVSANDSNCCIESGKQLLPLLQENTEHHRQLLEQQQHKQQRHQQGQLLDDQLQKESLLKQTQNEQLHAHIQTTDTTHSNVSFSKTSQLPVVLTQPRETENENQDVASQVKERHTRNGTRGEEEEEREQKEVRQTDDGQVVTRSSIDDGRSELPPGAQVLSEEVTTQEIILDITWLRSHELRPPSGNSSGSCASSVNSGRQARDSAERNDKKREPFRELNTRRVILMSDFDTEKNENINRKTFDGEVFKRSNNYASTGIDTQAESNCQPSSTASNPYRGESSSVADGTSKTDCGKALSSFFDTDVKLEFAQQSFQTDKINVDSGSFVDVRHVDTVKVLRVPSDTIYRVPTLSSVVEALTLSIQSDAMLLPVESHIRVTCDATEWQSRRADRESTSGGSQDTKTFREAGVDCGTGEGKNDHDISKGYVADKIHRTIFENGMRAARVSLISD